LAAHFGEIALLFGGQNKIREPDTLDLLAESIARDAFDLPEPTA
jgi:hypothetical protein